MTIKFLAYESREHVAAMLEGPVRALLAAPNPPAVRLAKADISTILAELDRVDRVARAKSRLSSDRSDWERKVIAENVKVEDAPAGTMCEVSNFSGGYRLASTQHKAKHVVNGRGYCGTHVEKARTRANYEAIAKHRPEYVEDEASRAIVDADRVVRDERSGRLV